MKRSRLLLSLSALLVVLLLAGCTHQANVNAQQKAEARAWSDKHWQQQKRYRSGRTMSVVGYEVVPIHGHRRDRGELSLNNRWGVGDEIPAPRIVARNPARWSPPPSQQPAVMQLKSSPRQRPLTEVDF